MKSISRCLFFFLIFFSSIVNADYTLGGGDYVKISVYGDSELTREARISENGLITLPLIGEVEVGGLTSIEAEKIIAEHLKKGGFIANPQVSVLVLEFLSKSVSILGGVSKPGRYPINRATDVKDIIADAGGLTSDASEIVTVIKGNKRNEYDLYEMVEDKGSPDHQVRLTGDETVYVNIRDVAVSGQVSRPGKYGIQGATRKITDFLALAGGPTELAGETLLFTSTNTGSADTVELNIDQLFRSPQSELNRKVSPGDVIYVPKAPQVYIYGEVQHPGMYKIDKNMTIMQAIAKAGGLTVRGTQRSVKLNRKDAQGAIVKQSSNLNTILMDEDVLYIEESLL